MCFHQSDGKATSRQQACQCCTNHAGADNHNIVVVFAHSGPRGSPSANRGTLPRYPMALMQTVLTSMMASHEKLRAARWFDRLCRLIFPGVFIVIAYLSLVKMLKGVV